MPQQMRLDDLALGRSGLAPAGGSKPARGAAPKRCVIVADSAGEIEAAYAGLIRDASEAENRVFVMAGTGADGNRVIRRLGAEPLRLPRTGGGGTRQDIRAYALALGGLTPDVVVAGSWHSGRMAIAGAARAGVSRIVAAFPELALALAPGGRTQARLRRECANLLTHCHAAIVPGLDRDPVLRGRSLLPPGLETTFIAGPGVDLSSVSHVPLAALTKGMVFLVIAYPGSEGGIAHYCEAARRLWERNGNAVFLTVSPSGEAPSSDLLALMRAHRGLVRYLGPREDMLRLMARAHALVFPAEIPCVPREIAEGLAIGRPVIAADIASRHQAVESGVNGYRVAPGDPDALTEAMLALLRRPDAIPRHAKQSRQIAVTRFDINAVTADMLGVLDLAKNG